MVVQREGSELTLIGAQWTKKIFMIKTQKKLVHKRNPNGWNFFLFFVHFFHKKLNKILKELWQNYYNTKNLHTKTPQEELMDKINNNNLHFTKLNS